MLVQKFLSLMGVTISGGSGVPQFLLVPPKTRHKIRIPFSATPSHQQQQNLNGNLAKKQLCLFYLTFI